MIANSKVVFDAIRQLMTPPGTEAEGNRISRKSTKAMTNQKERPIETGPRLKPQSGEMFIDSANQNKFGKLPWERDVSDAHKWADRINKGAWCYKHSAPTALQSLKKSKRTHRVDYR